MKQCLYPLVVVLFIGSSVSAQPPQERTGELSSRSALELLNRVDQLEKEIRQLRGDMEVVNHELSGIKRRQRELYLDIDRRLSELELGNVRSPSGGAAATDSQLPASDATENVTQAPASAPASDAIAPAAASGDTDTAVQTPSREEKDSYRSAFNLLKEGRYDRSIKAFASFLSTYPNSTYADNAQYWLGEANYVSRKYTAAVKEFDKVLSNFPDSSKVPDAMLKLGFTYYELKQWDKAREILTSVMQKYPKSSAARLADTRLQRMKNEGH